MKSVPAFTWNSVIERVPVLSAEGRPFAIALDTSAFSLIGVWLFPFNFWEPQSEVSPVTKREAWLNRRSFFPVVSVTPKPTPVFPLAPWIAVTTP